MLESTTTDNHNDNYPQRERVQTNFFCLEELLQGIMAPPGEEYKKAVTISEESLVKIDLMNKAIHAHLAAALARCEERRQRVAAYPDVLPTDVSAIHYDVV